MKLSQLKPAERRLIVILGSLVGAWAVLQFLVQPLWGRMSDLRVGIESRLEKLQALRRLADEETQVTRQFASLAPYVESAAGGDAQQQLLLTLETLARESSLHLNLKPRTQLPAQQTKDRFEVEIELDGPQAAFFQFFDKLLALPQLVSVQRLRIASQPSAGQADNVRAAILLEGQRLPSRPAAQS